VILSRAHFAGSLACASLAAIANFGDVPPKPSATTAVSGATPQVLAMDVFAQGDIVDLLLFEETTSGKRLRHQRSQNGAVTWSIPSVIDRGDLGIVGHHRGMDPQIAASGQTVVVLWTTPGNSDWGEGPLATALSTDGGRTWRAGSNPADDGSKGGHSFLELAADTEGGFQAFWLDSRDGGQGLRSAASRDGGVTWTTNISIDTRTCDCCWNRSIVQGPDAFFVLYRDRDPRDMALAFSGDGGQTWTRRGTVGAFNWAIDGCPHTGGGIARTADHTAEFLHATVWTGATGRIGAHVLRSPDGGISWNEPTRLGSERAKHTDLAASGRTVAAVWDETRTGQSLVFAVSSRDHGQTWSKPVQLSSPDRIATHPLVIATHGRFVAFWSERSGGDNARAQWRSRALPRSVP
jgi:hypothetical protein